MELIYLYVKKYENQNKLKRAIIQDNEDFVIKDTGINLSDSFECFFDEENGLKIKNIKPIWDKFYSANIKSLKVLAGRNGSGKTTILDIIGMMRDERCDDHLVRDNGKAYFSAEYFLVYHMKDNQFLIEIVANIMKEEDCWIKNLETASIFREGKNMHYKLPIGYVFNYNYEKNEMKATHEHCFSNYLIDDSHEKKIAEHANIYYFSNSFSHRKTNSMRFKPRQDRDDEYLIKRQDLRDGISEPNDYHSLYKIIFSEKYEKFVNEIISTKLLIQITDSYSDEFLLEKERYRVSADENATETIDELKRIVREISKNLYRSNGLPDRSSSIIINRKKSKKTEVIAKYNSKQSYLLDLSCRYILNALNSLVEMVYEKNIGISIKDEINELVDVDINRYFNVIKENENVLFDPVLNPFKELADFNKIAKMFCDGVNICEDVSEAVIIEKFGENTEINLFNKNIINNIILARYLLIRIESQVKLKESMKYQIAFEEVLMQLLKLDDTYFYDSGIIINSKKHQDDHEITRFFEIVNKWYKVESNYHNDIWNRFEFKMPYVSDGERCILEIFSKFINIIENEDRTLHVILMDEPDQRLHPEWSRQFIQLIIEGIEALYKSNYEPQNKGLNIQLIISTHSPFILSDIRKGDLIILNQDKDNEGENKLLVEVDPVNTFSANLYDILNNSFFLDNTIGEFAKKKINTTCMRIFDYSKSQFINAIRDEKIDNSDLKKLKYLIEQISEPIFKKSLTRQLEVRSKWLDESDVQTGLDTEVKDVFEQFSKLNNDKKRRFIKQLIINEHGESYD